MKIDKKYIKFYEIDQNRYYLLKFDDELHLATESFIPLEKKILFFKKRKDLTQGLKLLQLTGPILTLFQEVMNADIDKEDKDFKDMTTYKKVDGVELRKSIEESYKMVLDQTLEEAQKDFESWKDDFILNNKNIKEEDVNKIIQVNEDRLKFTLMTIKENNIFNYLNFKWKTGENLVIKKMLEQDNMEFLYSHRIGTGYKIYYLYDLDIFGTVTIYKIQCVKDTIKSIETFIYNREIIQEMTACMINNNL